MVDFWIIFAFVGGCVASVALLYGFNWAVERRALSITNAKYAKIGAEKKQLVKGEKAALALEVKDAMTAEGDFVKEKVPKLLTALTNHPEASEDLLKMAMKWM